MKVRIYGFRPEPKSLPTAMNAPEIFKALLANNGAPIDRKHLIRASATTVTIEHDGKKEEWFAGLILKARDAKSYNHLSQDGGKLVLSSKQLGDGKIAEISYCIAHPTTCNGFIASYHGGPGFSVLKYVCARLFAKAAKDRRNAELKEKAGDRESRSEIYERYKGKLDLTQLVRTENLKQMLKNLKRLSSVELRFTNVKSSGGYFRKLTSHAITESEKFSFPMDFSLDDDMADEIAMGTEHDDVIEAFFEGTDKTGEKLRFSTEMARNMMVFAEVEYDSLLGSLELDLEDWAPTIQKSPVIDWLFKQTRSAKNRQLLET